MYCTNCGNKLQIGDKYCSQCGRMTTLSANYKEIAFKSSYKKESKCPKCGGSGRMSMSQSSDGVAISVATFGIGTLLNYMLSDGKLTCDRCNGKGIVSE